MSRQSLPSPKCERPKRVDDNIEWQLMAPSLYDDTWPMAAADDILLSTHFRLSLTPRAAVHIFGVAAARF